MKVINLSEHDSIIGKYLQELRDIDYQKNRLLFRNNVERIGRIEAYEMSKALSYTSQAVTTPLGIANINLPTDDVVLAAILRAGIALHRGFIEMLDHAGNAFVSAYREYTDEKHEEVRICVEYLASPSLEGKTLVLIDPMLATGGSVQMTYKALLKKGTPSKVFAACVLATPEAIDLLEHTLPEDSILWCAAIDPGMNANKYIVPGFGDAGDLCFGEK